MNSGKSINSENQLEMNKKINRTAIKGTVKIFPIYNKKRNDTEQTYIQLIKMVSSQVSSKIDFITLCEGARHGQGFTTQF